MDYIQNHIIVEIRGHRGAACLENAAYKMLDLIPVYPVEDETKWTDKAGTSCRTPHLVRKGATAKDLAYKIHTDLGDNFIRAINCRTHRVVGHDYILQPTATS